MRDAIGDVVNAAFDGALGPGDHVDDPTDRRVDADCGEHEDNEESPSSYVSEVNERFFHTQPLG